jgi:type IV pilus assembly protein PilM
VANSGNVWGIDIGQCALKAMRCSAGPGDTVVADAFDYIEYPKILNQPEADPKAMVQEALEQFLSRNKVKGDKVSISVSGQSGLARFFKPPPVDAKKMPELVKYEARNQIPFALEDVIWDWQMLGGTEVDGFALDTEVGLFAMKRDAVFRALEPFDHAEIECDVVQLAPEAVFNYVAHDVIRDTGAGDNYDSDNPPPSLAVLSMGTDTSDLIVTNGFRLWQRSIPIGGNHFTKQLSKELKLTFAKAEHLKRNARQAEDPKAIFQAMRTVFNDLVTELQRSLSYFQTVDRKAKIKGLVLLGNAVKLPGLSQYLSKNLGLDVVNVDGFSTLTGGGVVASPSFKDNMLSFGVCYGLCLQGLGLGKLRTNLVPRELITERMIRAKKPWALASYAGLLLACSFNFFFHYNAWSGVHNKEWDIPIKNVDAVVAESTRYKDEFKKRQDELLRIKNIGEELVGNVDRRLLWLELLKAISVAMPKTDFSKLPNGTPTNLAPGSIPDHKQYPIDLRKEIHVEYIESEYFPDLATWFANEEVKRRYAEERRIAAGEAPATVDPAAPAAPGPNGQVPPATPPAATPPAAVPPVTTPPAGPATATTAAATTDAGPKGPGWVIEIRGHHYYNRNRGTAGVVHVRDTVIKNLEEGEVSLPIEFGTGPGSPTKFENFTMKELGIGYVILAESEEIDRYNKVINEDFEDPDADAGGLGGNGPKKKEGPRNDDPPEWTIPKYTFTVQFTWTEKLLRQRLQEREAKRLEAKRLEEEAAAQGAPVPGVLPGTLPPSTK